MKERESRPFIMQNESRQENERLVTWECDQRPQKLGE
jgi:hypothetical protein